MLLPVVLERSSFTISSCASSHLSRVVHIFTAIFSPPSEGAHFGFSSKLLSAAVQLIAFALVSSFTPLFPISLSATPLY